MLQTSANNKDIEKYKRLFPVNQTTVKGPQKRTGYNANIRRKQRRAHFAHKRIATQRKSNERFIKNLSNLQLTDNQVNVISKGLKFVPTPVTDENNIDANSCKTLKNSQDECDYNTYSTQKIKNHTRFTSNQTGYHRFKSQLPLKATWKVSKSNLQRSNHQNLKTICHTTNTKPLQSLLITLKSISKRQIKEQQLS